MMFHRPTLAVTFAASLSFAGCKKNDPPASPPARSDTAAAPEPRPTPPKSNAAPPVAQPTPAAPETSTPPPALPDHDVAPDDSTDEGSADRTADRTAPAAGSVEISDERRLAAMQRRADLIHEQFDANHDGKLSPEELANAHGRRARFDDPFALDTNHDGDISPDELAAGLKQRAEQRRAELLGAGGAPPQQP